MLGFLHASLTQIFIVALSQGGFRGHKKLWLQRGAPHSPFEEKLHHSLHVCFLLGWDPGGQDSPWVEAFLQCGHRQWKLPLGGPYCVSRVAVLQGSSYSCPWNFKNLPEVQLLEWRTQTQKATTKEVSPGPVMATLA